VTAAQTRLTQNAHRSFGVTGLAAVAAGVGLGLWVGGSPLVMAVLALTVPVVLLGLVYRQLPAHLPHEQLGPANAVTLARSVFVAGIAALLATPALSEHPGLVSVLALCTIILDGVDGLVARHKKVVSGFGAALDGELDALFVLVLTVAIWLLDRAGPWVLLAGSARFLFLAAMWRWPWLSAPLPPSNHRKLCFGFLVWSLIAVPLPWLSVETGQVLSFFATVLLVLSFAVDVAWLHARHTGRTHSREDLPPAAPGDHAWGRLLAAAHEGVPLVPLADPAEQALLERFSPVLAVHPDRPSVIGHLAQSLDGHIALECGASQWISGAEDILHTHRLRALVDAVLVGVETVLNDNPRLTVREAKGPHPLRVVLDPGGRLGPDCALCTDPHRRTLILTRHASVPPGGRLGTARVRGIDDDDGFLHPQRLLAALADEGVRRVLVEGGGVTVSRFIEAGCMDRLHLVVSPVLLGEGRRALHLPGVPSLDVAQRPTCRTESLGPDTLFDIDLSERTAAERATPGTSA